MGKRYNRLGTNLLILSIVMAFLLYITYASRNYHEYSLKADNNPLIRADDAAREPASYEEDIDAAGTAPAISSVEKSESGDIHEGQNMEQDNNDIDNAGTGIKDINTKAIETAKETQSAIKTETGEKGPKQEEIEPGSAKLQAMRIASSRITTSGSKLQEDVDLDGTLNKYVLDMIKTYKAGNYPYLLNDDYQNYNGVTENLYYDGELLLKANPNGNRASCCTGITFEVFFKAMQNRNQDLGIDINDFNGMNKEELYDFALTWYVAKGPKDISNIAVAMEKYGVGKEIHNMEELKAGDFIDFSRENGTGHSAIFINWIRERDRITGLKYWSSQGSTNGISYKEEYFNIKRKDGSKYGNVIIDSLHMGRIGPVSEYKGFK